MYVLNTLSVCYGLQIKTCLLLKYTVESRIKEKSLIMVIL